jgi:hypothetical protein
LQWPAVLLFGHNPRRKAAVTSHAYISIPVQVFVFLVVVAGVAFFVFKRKRLGANYS